MSAPDKDIEIFALRHQIRVLQRPRADRVASPTFGLTAPVKVAREPLWEAKLNRTRDEDWLTRWAMQVEAATARALREIVSTYGYEIGEHRVGNCPCREQHPRRSRPWGGASATTAMARRSWSCCCDSRTSR